MKFIISDANSSGTSSCKNLLYHNCYLLYKGKRTKNCHGGWDNTYLYRMPSMSDNNHLKLALHLTNCQSSVTIQADSQNVNLE